MARRKTPATLLGGPYDPPPFRVSDKATCRFREREVVITSWTDAPISWPRCQPISQRGGGGLLVDDELVRAIRTESAQAIRSWFGVSSTTVWSWRRAFGVRQFGTEGSQRLHRQALENAATATRGKKRSRGEIARRVATCKALGYRPPQRWAETGWKAEELALLGRIPDAAVAKRIGRSRDAVRRQRGRLGIAALSRR
jgi:hypothetical protein